ncbi:MAG: PAS domain S-box protein [Bacteroidota bacterium]
MNRNSTDHKISLSRKIFLYFLGVVFLSLVSLGYGWLESKISDYQEEVKSLKKHYSETRKLEIKNEVLQVKDNIQWAQDSLVDAVKRTLASQARQMKLPKDVSGSLGTNSSNALPPALSDSFHQARVPVFLANRNGKLLYAFDPYDTIDGQKPGKNIRELLTLVLKQPHHSGLISLYRHGKHNDSTLTHLCFYDNDLIPGFIFATFAGEHDFEQVLQVSVLESITRMRSNVNEYVFVNTLSGMALITHGRYNKPPIDILKKGDTAWISIFKAQQGAASHSAGIYHSYTFLKPSTLKPSLKTAYFSYMPDWKWIIGTGFYEDDVNAFIELKRKALFAGMERKVFHVMIYLLTASLFCYLLVSFFSRRFRKNIDLFTDFFGKAAQGNMLLDISRVSYREFAKIAESANRMVVARQEAETRLRKSEEKFSKAFKNSPDVIIITTQDGLVEEVNDSASRLTGYSRAEFLGESILTMNLWKDPACRNAYITQLREKGRVLNLDADFRAKSGEIRNCLISGEIIVLDDREYILSIIRDITENRNMQAEVFGLERRFRETLENIRLISVLLDINGRVSFCNDYLLELTGYSREEVVGKNWFRLIMDETRPEAEQLFFNNQIDGITTSFDETKIRTKSGESLVVQFNNTLLRDARGKIIGTTSIGEDITERKHAEMELRKKMDELQRFHNLTIGRELRMIGLKKEVNELLRQSGLEEKYRISE